MNYATFFAAFKAADPVRMDQIYSKKFSVQLDEGRTLSFVMGVSVRAPEGADFSVSAVFRTANEKTQPVFMHVKQEGRHHLRSIVIEHNGDAYIVVYDQSGLDGVYPVKDLVNGVYVPSMANGKPVPRLVSGGINLKQRYQLKLDIADKLGVEPIWTRGEKLIDDTLSAARRDAIAAERARNAEAAAAARLAADKARDAKIAELMQRPKVVAMTAKGEKRYGIPILEKEEDAVLPDNTFCIRMDDEGAPVECYILRKKSGNGRITRENRTQVFPLGASRGGVDLSVVDTVVVQIGDELVEANVFKTFDAVETMRIEHDLNGGTIVGVRKDGEKVDLYRVTRQKSTLVEQVSA